MIRNVYILHIDDSRSLQYLNDCLESCKRFPDINAIPVQGYKGVSYKDICKEYGLGIIPYYVNQMEQNGDTINKAFSCTAGHIKIWRMIVESGEAGVILEHDAIIKAPLSSLEVSDDTILWLGPRIEYENDYVFPIGVNTTNIEVDRWEGTHAYAITPKTAQHLLDCMKKYGLNDSIDGQLGMRNMFDMKFQAVDPPVAVAVVGNRESCIESHGNPGFWNSHHTDQFLKNLKPNCKIPPVRKLVYSNLSFNNQIPYLETVLRNAGKLEGKEQAVLVLGGYEGLSSVWLSNNLLQHDDSYMQVISQFRGTSEHKAGQWPHPNMEEVCRYNTYFSKYYFKINIVPVYADNDLLSQAAADPEVRFDVIYVDGNHEYKDVLHDGILSWNLLKSGGVMIFDDGELVKSAVDNIINAVNCTVLCKGDIIALQKN